jgi:hypothetical protein
MYKVEDHSRVPLVNCLLFFTLRSINRTNGGNSKRFTNGTRPMFELFVTMKLVVFFQVCFNEIYSGMWVRNGHQIRGQAMTYIQSHFCNSTIDADIYLLQVCVILFHC